MKYGYKVVYWNKVNWRCCLSVSMGTDPFEKKCNWGSGQPKADAKDIFVRTSCAMFVIQDIKVIYNEKAQLVKSCVC